MAVTSLAEAMALLYGHPLESFVEERSVLVKSLRAAKERDLANQVKSLRKPSAIAAEVNRIVRADPGAVELILQAAELLRAGQAGHLQDQGINVGELQQQYRAAIKALAQTAETKPAEVRAALEAATIDVESNEALRTGSLVAVPEPVSVFGIADAAALPADELAVRRARREAKDAAKVEEARAEARTATADAEQLAADQLAADQLAASQVAADALAAEQAKAEQAKAYAEEAARHAAAEKAAKAAEKERAKKRKVVAKQHREALRAQLAALDEQEAATSAAEEHAATVLELENQARELDQQLVDLGEAAQQARDAHAVAQEAETAAAARAEEAETAVQGLAERLEELSTD